MQRFRLPAVSIAVIKDYKIHWAKAYGVADVETGQLADTATLFQAGSISKPAFAVIAMKLAHAGRFSLDANVNTLLRSWHVPQSDLTRQQPVTLRSLLSHTNNLFLRHSQRARRAVILAMEDANRHPGTNIPNNPRPGSGPTPSDLARLVIEIQRAIQGPKGTVLTQAAAREMLTPTGVGEQGQGLAIEKRGEGWYFSHSGSNWNYRANLVGHMRKGYGVAIMTNSENGWGVITELEARIASAYNWDSLDKPILR